MTYTNIDTQLLAARAAGDLKGRIGVGLLKQAATRINIVGSIDSKESGIARSIIEGGMPQSWTTMVLYFLDVASALPTNPTATNPTDVQIDTAVASAWAYMLASRQLS